MMDGCSVRRAVKHGCMAMGRAEDRHSYQTVHVRLLCTCARAIAYLPLPTPCALSSLMLHAHESCPLSASGAHCASHGMCDLPKSSHLGYTPACSHAHDTHLAVRVSTCTACVKRVPRWLQLPSLAPSVTHLPGRGFVLVRKKCAVNRVMQQRLVHVAAT